MMKNYNVAPHLLLIQSRRVLLLLRSKTGLMDGHWCPITGKIESDETPTDMLRREAHEEVGVHVDAIEFSNVVDHVSPSYYNPSQKYIGLDLFFISKSWKGDIVNKEPEKHAALQWFPLDGLPSNTIDSVKHGICNILQNKIYDICDFLALRL